MDIKCMETAVKIVKLGLLHSLHEILELAE
jgi:hypothetical protein